MSVGLQDGAPQPQSNTLALALLNAARGSSASNAPGARNLIPSTSILPEGTISSSINAKEAPPSRHKMLLPRQDVGYLY